MKESNEKKKTEYRISSYKADIKKVKVKALVFSKIFFRTAFIFLSALLFGGIVLAFGTYLKYSSDFESIKPVSNSTQTIFYDKNGNEIYKDAGAAEPKSISLSEVPEVVKQSTLAAEDLDFYKHGPIDLKGIARATYLNWTDSDKTGLSKIGDLLSENSYTKGGGSTITQQLVKNIYLTPEKSFQRKIKEVVYSYKLENKYSKDKILEMYLNQIYYGAQALGIENASRIYFNKDVKDLNLAEASMLAGLPQAPSYYSPVGDNYLASKKRQEYVLQQMYYAKFITLEEAKEAANEDLTIYGKQVTLNKHPYFNQYVKDELANYFDKETEDLGKKVYTTLDPEKQEIAEKKVAEWAVKLKDRGATNAATVASDPKTNEILAMVGGVDWNNSKVNVATSLRQPGSSFKPIVYTTALENGYTAASVLIDKAVNFGGNPPYIPRNYNGGYSGYVTIRNALARSLNVPAVEMGKLVGLDKVVDLAHKMGITSINNDPWSYGLPLSLGSAEVRLVDMVDVYSTFADSGKRMPQTTLKKVIDQKGNEVRLKNRNKKQIIKPQTAYIISSILSDNNARSVTFGSSSPLKTDHITAVKTGTTDNYADSWTMGYSPSLVVGVWMGNNDHKPMRQVSGIEGAAYIWHDIMTEALKSQPNEEFTKPEGIEQAWIASNGTLAKYQGRPNLLENFLAGTVPKEKIDFSYLKQF